MTAPAVHSHPLINPLAEVQVLLRQLLAHHEGMPLNALRRVMNQVHELLRQIRISIDGMGNFPQAPVWADARAGIRSATAAADALNLAIHEGGTAHIQEELEATLAAIDRTASYVDRLLLQCSEVRAYVPGERGHSDKRRRTNPEHTDEHGTGYGQPPVTSCRGGCTSPGPGTRALPAHPGPPRLPESVDQPADGTNPRGRGCNPLFKS